MKPKKLLSVLLVLAMLCTLLPAAAAPITPEGGWADLQAAFDAAGEDPDAPTIIALAQDYTAADTDEPLTIPAAKAVTLDLQGHTINGSALNIDNHFVLEVCGSLTLMDSGSGGAITAAYKNIVNVAAGGSFTMLGGKVIASALDGGAVLVEEGGSFYLSGGTVEDSGAAYGVFAASGSAFTLSGAPVLKGGVFLDSGVVITIGGMLTNAVPIAVESVDESVFTSGWGAYMHEKNPADYFISSMGYCMVALDSFEAVLLEPTGISDWDEMRSALTSDGVYRLESDLTATGEDDNLTIDSDVTVTLDLNGHTIDGTALGQNVFDVCGSLTLMDSVSLGKVIGGDIVFVKGAFTMLSGEITSAGAFNGTVFVYDGGSFTLKGGTVEDDGNLVCVHVRSGSFTLSGAPLIKGHVLLDTSMIITIGGALENPVPIAVKSVYEGAFTEGWSAFMSGKNPADYFSSFENDCLVALDNGEAALVPPAEISDFSGLLGALSQGGAYSLESGISSSGTSAVTVPSDAIVTLDLRGNTVELQNSFEIEGILTVLDSVGGGSLEGNVTEQLVRVNGGSFTMLSGGISASGEIECAVYVEDGSFTLMGGAIAAEDAYGVNVQGGSFTLSGAPSISGGVYLARGNVITLGGVLEPDDPIAVKLENDLGAFTCGWNDRVIREEYGNYFTSADSVLTVDVDNITSELCIGMAYIDENGETQVCKNGTVITGETTELPASGWYVVKDAVSMDSLTFGQSSRRQTRGLPASVTDVNVILGDVMTVEEVQSNAELNVFSSGYDDYKKGVMQVISSKGSEGSNLLYAKDVNLYNNSNVNVMQNTMRDGAIIENNFWVGENAQMQVSTNYGQALNIGGDADIEGGSVITVGTGTNCTKSLVEVVKNMKMDGGTLTSTGQGWAVEVKGNTYILDGAATLTGENGQAFNVGGDTNIEGGRVLLQGDFHCGENLNKSGGYLKVLSKGSGTDPSLKVGGDVNITGGSTLLETEAQSGQSNFNELSAEIGGDLTQSGGNTVVKGNLYAQGIYYEGGVLQITSKVTGETITLNGTGANDRVQFGSVDCDGVILVTDFTDGTSIFEAGDYTSDEFNDTMAGKTLRPALDEPAIAAHSLLLADEIGVRFRVAFPLDFVSDGCCMKFASSDGRTATVEYDEAETIEGSTDRYFNFGINALELNDNITATLHYGDGQTVSDDYSAMTYIRTVQEDKDAREELLNLVNALQAYGYYLQGSDWTDGAEHTDIDEPETDLDNSDIDAATDAVSGFNVTTSFGNSGITDVKVSLTLNARTAINVSVRPADGVTITSAGYTERTIGEDTYYQFTVGKIGPKNLDHQYTVEVETDAGTDKATVKVSAMSYVKLALNDLNLAKNNKLALAAYYLYYLAAENYPVT